MQLIWAKFQFPDKILPWRPAKRYPVATRPGYPAAAPRGTVHPGYPVASTQITGAPTRTALHDRRYPVAHTPATPAALTRPAHTTGYPVATLEASRSPPRPATSRLPCSPHGAHSSSSGSPAALPHPGYPVARTKGALQQLVRSPHAAPPRPGYPAAAQAGRPPHEDAGAARRPVTSRLPCSCTGRPPAHAAARRSDGVTGL